MDLPFPHPLLYFTLSLKCTCCVRDTCSKGNVKGQPGEAEEYMPQILHPDQKCGFPGCPTRLPI